jgi:hypothetical protein
MTITTAEIRGIQAGLSGRDPQLEQQGSGPIDAANSPPSGATAGVDVTLADGKSALQSVYVVLPSDSSVTAWTARWWGYYAGIETWAPLRGGDVSSTDNPAGETEVLPTGPLSRLYLELLTLTAGASQGLVVYVGPCSGGI